MKKFIIITISVILLAVFADYLYWRGGIWVDLRPFAEVTAERSGIRLAVDTTRPGIQFYMGGFLNESGKSFYRKNSGFCLETQCWPNAVNHPHFPSVRLEPGKGHHSLTRYRFSLIK